MCAVRSALEEGILCGGGLALFRESLVLIDECELNSNSDENIASYILSNALQSPMDQIITNAGVNVNDIADNIFIKNYNYGYDVKNEKYGDMFKMGVIDPLKVTKNALQNAVSVATTILGTNAIITHKRANEKA